MQTGMEGKGEAAVFEQANGEERPTGAAALSKADLRLIDSLLTETFDSVMSIEEQLLDNRLTQGLSIAEVHTIAAVGLHEMTPMTTVAARLGVSLPTVSNAVNRLVKKGHVQRIRSEEDRRQVLLELTSMGRKAYRAHAAFHRKLAVEAIEGLSAEEAAALIRALGKVKGFFDANSGQAGN